MKLTVRLITRSALIAGCVLAVAVASSAAAPQTPVAQVKALYRTVLTAEYFGPSKAVCSNLTAKGERVYEIGFSSCTAAFKAQQHVLKHRTEGVDDSGYWPSQWRSVVNRVLAHLKVAVHGSSASAIGGQSGIPGKTKLVKTGGSWMFSSYPPSIQP